jgi:hypothetical protein
MQRFDKSPAEADEATVSESMIYGIQFSTGYSISIHCSLKGKQNEWYKFHESTFLGEALNILEKQHKKLYCDALPT